jgi:chemotaxis protein methyltransferase CheR
MLSPHAFEAVTDLFHQVSGIRLSDAKQALVAGRLQKLAQQRGLSDVNDYVELLLRERDEAELVKVIDKLTTNETYFFREPEHFRHLEQLVAARPPGSAPLRVWSAASSTGEEAYSIAMLLGNAMGLNGWEIVGTDLSTQVVESAQRGLYPLERAENVRQADLKRWCLRGQGDYEGQLLIHRDLRARVRFLGANLTRALPDIGQFDVIFLRNVLIYFDNPGKAAIVRNVITRLKPDGVLYTGHAESIINLGLPVKPVSTAVYCHV